MLGEMIISSRRLHYPCAGNYTSPCAVKLLTLCRRIENDSVPVPEDHFDLSNIQCPFAGELTNEAEEDNNNNCEPVDLRRAPPQVKMRNSSAILDHEAQYA